MVFRLPHPTQVTFSSPVKQVAGELTRESTLGKGALALFYPGGYTVKIYTPLARLNTPAQKKILERH